MKTETFSFNQGERKYPVTGLVPSKPLINYDEKGPYGDFGGEEGLIEYLETLAPKDLRKMSPLWIDMVENLGGYRFCERLYDDKPETELDRAVYNTRSCRSIFNRNGVVREQVLELLREHTQAGRKSLMEIYDLGSGPSRYNVEAFAKYRAENGSGIFPAHATCIDIDPSALRMGKNLAREAGVKKYIDYKRGRMGTMLKKGRIRDADLITAIGVICPLSDDITMKLFGRVRKALKPGGKFYTCAMRHHPLEKFLRDTAGWKLNHREPEKLEKMLREAGYGNLDIYLGPEELFVMALGQKTE